MRCPSQPHGIKGPSSTLNGCEQIRATFAKAEEEMSTAWAAHRLLRSIPGAWRGQNPGWPSLPEAGQDLQLWDDLMGLEKIYERGGGGGDSVCA